LFGTIETKETIGLMLVIFVSPFDSISLNFGREVKFSCLVISSCYFFTCQLMRNVKIHFYIEDKGCYNMMCRVLATCGWRDRSWRVLRKWSPHVFFCSISSILCRILPTLCKLYRLAVASDCHLFSCKPYVEYLR
jgi:hypothetical protein